MSIAETATVAVDLKLGTTGSFRGATSELQGIEAAAARGVTGTGLLSRGFGAVSGAASGTVIEISATGEDAATAVETLARLIECKFDEA